MLEGCTEDCTWSNVLEVCTSDLLEVCNGEFTEIVQYRRDILEGCTGDCTGLLNRSCTGGRTGGLYCRLYGRNVLEGCTRDCTGGSVL